MLLDIMRSTVSLSWVIINLHLPFFVYRREYNGVTSFTSSFKNFLFRVTKFKWKANVGLYTNVKLESVAV
jgi:hypothetical protein